ncbi:MAG: hypothetical protein U7123_23615 [Potamolinea sp.]
MAKIWRYITLAGVVILLLVLCSLQGLPGFVQADQSLITKLKTPTSVIPASLFSLNLINLEYGAAWPNIPFKGWRNTYADWSILEKNKDEWNFKNLDSDISLAQQYGVEIILILKSTPTWASKRPTETGCCYPLPWTTKGNIAEARNIEDWKNYIRTVATRYKGQVNYYELWNEANVPRFYSGTIEKLILLNRAAYQVLKEVDPSITVISPALSPCCNSLKYLENYFIQDGGNYADVIGYHFYVAPQSPEAMLPMIQQVQALMVKYRLDNKPLWNTESGWKIINRDKNINDEEWAGKALSSVDASAYIARSYILSWAAGVERLYWYAWGHRSMGLTDYDARTPKPVATAYTEVQKWLVGTQMTACGSDQKNNWVCELKRERGYLAWIVWNPTQNLSFNLPKTWGVKQIRNLSGEKRSLSDVNQVEVSRTPLLLERVIK